MCTINVPVSVLVLILWGIVRCASQADSAHDGYNLRLGDSSVPEIEQLNLNTSGTGTGKLN